jgi:DNA-binding CsgD family transcriptional regulator
MQVGGIAMNLTKKKRLENSLSRLMASLHCLNAALGSNLAAISPGNRRKDEEAAQLRLFLRMLESCTLEAQLILRMLKPTAAAVALSYGHPLVPLQLSTLEPADCQTVSIASLGNEKQAAMPLSLREQEILKLLAEGKSSKEVAAFLDISTRTVETHRARIMLKLDLHSVGALVLYAVKNHLIQL